MRPPWFSNPARTRRTPGSSSTSIATLPISRGPSARTVVEVDEPGARERLVAELVGVAEQLVAAADREDHRAAVGRRVQRVALDLGQVERAQLLVAVLAAADVVEVGAVGVELFAQTARLQLETDPAPAAAALEQQQVAAVGVDVHQVGIQRADAQPRSSGTEHHHRAADVVGGRADRGSPSRVKPAARPSRSSPRAVSRRGGSGRARRSARPSTATVSRRRSSTNPSRSARTAVGWLEYTTPSSSRTSGSGRPKPSATSKSSSASAIAIASSAARQEVPASAPEERDRASAPAEQLDRLHRHDAQREALAEVERRERRRRPSWDRSGVHTGVSPERVGELGEQLGISVERRDAVAGAREIQRHATGARADVEHRVAVRRRPASATAAGPRRRRRTRGRAR